MNFLTLKTRFARRTGKATASLDSATSARAADAINEVHRAILRRPGMAPLRSGLMTVASVAGQQAYALPTEGIARINRIWDATNQRKLEYRTLDWLRTADPNPQQGTPWAWVPTGYVEVHTQPSNASSLFVVSTSAADTTQTVTIEGFVTGGYYRTATVTLTGTTAVNVSSAISTFVQVTKFYLSATCAGTVTLTEDSGSGTALGQITIGKTRAQYYAFLLEDIPSSVVTYTCDVLRGIPDMSAATDEPLLPEDFHDLLIDGAELKEMRKQDDPQRWRMVHDSYQQGLAALESFITAHPDYTPNATMGATSRLGGWFPAGS